MKVLLFVVLATVTLQNKCGHQGNASNGDSTNQDNMETLKALHAKYRNGEIESCKYYGALVYKAGLNAYDAGSAIFDKDGNKIASCNYGFGKPDTVCEQLTDCEDVYRVADNIWEKPVVDKYGLAK